MNVIYSQAANKRTCVFNNKGMKRFLNRFENFEENNIVRATVQYRNAERKS